MSRTNEILAQQIAAKLVGTVITNVVTTEDCESFGFQCCNKHNSFTVWVDCDPEGNGSGFLDIQDGPMNGDSQVMLPSGHIGGLRKHVGKPVPLVPVGAMDSWAGEENEDVRDMEGRS